MACNHDKVTLNKVNGRRQGKAVLVDHVLFDQLWMHGDKKIPDKLTVRDSASAVEETKEVEQVLSCEQVDVRIEEAFARCFLELIEETAFPIEPS